MTRPDVAMLDASSRGGLACAQAPGPRELAVGLSTRTTLPTCDPAEREPPASFPRRDVEGRPLLMEVNSRLSASVELAVRAGICRGTSCRPTGRGSRWLPRDLGRPRHRMHELPRPARAARLSRRRDPERPQRSCRLAAPAREARIVRASTLRRWPAGRAGVRFRDAVRLRRCCCLAGKRGASRRVVECAAPRSGEQRSTEERSQTAGTGQAVHRGRCVVSPRLPRLAQSMPLPLTYAHTPPIRIIAFSGIWPIIREHVVTRLVQREAGQVDDIRHRPDRRNSAATASDLGEGSSIGSPDPYSSPH